MANNNYNCITTSLTLHKYFYIITYITMCNSFSAILKLIKNVSKINETQFNCFLNTIMTP